jgi:hypothetical protein
LEYIYIKKEEAKIETAEMETLYAAGYTKKG